MLSKTYLEIYRPYEEALRSTVNEKGEDVKHKGDCVIRAIVFCTGLPYFQVWEALQAGVKFCTYRSYKKKDSGGYFEGEYEYALTQLGIKWVKLPAISRHYEKHATHGKEGHFIRKGTISQNIAKFPKGLYLHKSNRHLIGIKNGQTNHKAARYQTLALWKLDISSMVAPKGVKKEAPKPAPAAPDRPSIVSSKEVIPYTRVWGLLQDATREAGYSRCRKSILQGGKEVSFKEGTKGVHKGDSLVVICRTKKEKVTIHVTIG